MKIQYYLNGRGDYITPCPNNMKLIEGIGTIPCMVGSPSCQSCKCFRGEHLKTVACEYVICQPLGQGVIL